MGEDLTSFFHPRKYPSDYQGTDEWNISPLVLGARYRLLHMESGKWILRKQYLVNRVDDRNPCLESGLFYYYKAVFFLMKMKIGNYLGSGGWLSAIEDNIRWNQNLIPELTEVRITGIVIGFFLYDTSVIYRMLLFLHRKQERFHIRRTRLCQH